MPRAKSANEIASPCIVAFVGVVEVFNVVSAITGHVEPQCCTVLI